MKRIIKPEVISTESPFKNKYVSLRTDKIVFKHREEDGKLEEMESDYYTIDSPDFVIVIAMKDKEVLVINQYRWSVRGFINGFVCGMIEKDQNPEEAAKKELLEEAGLKAKTVKFLGKTHPLAGQNSCTAHAFFTDDFEEEESGLEEFEKFTNLTKEWVPIEKYRQMIIDGKIKDGPALSAWALLMEYIK